MTETHTEPERQQIWPDDYDLKAQCKARGTDLCWKFASRGSCGNCYVGGLHEEDAAQSACALWDKTVRLLPPDIDALSESKTCLFDAGSDPEPTDGYAVFDMANPEPYTAKGMFFGYGKKVRSPVGSLVTLHVAIGKRCRRAFRTVAALRIGCFVAMVALAIVLLAIPQITEPMVNAFVLLPAVFLALMGVAGYALGRSLAHLYMQRRSDEINFDVARIPLVAAMLRRDWYFFQASAGMPRLLFTRKHDFGLLIPPQRASSNIDTSDSAVVN